MCCCARLRSGSLCVLRCLCVTPRTSLDVHPPFHDWCKANASPLIIIVRRDFFCVQEVNWNMKFKYCGDNNAQVRVRSEECVHGEQWLNLPSLPPLATHYTPLYLTTHLKTVRGHAGSWLLQREWCGWSGWCGRTWVVGVGGGVREQGSGIGLF